MSKQQQNGQWKVIDESRGVDRTCDSEDEAETVKNDMISLGADGQDIQIVPPSEATSKPSESDENEAEAQHESQQAQVVEPAQQPAEPPESNTELPDELSHNPIAFLRKVNDEFVNTIKNKPAISKQGFRFIQREFGITTESEVVEVLDDPVGCIVWAKASLPDGHSAEAHGEGYKFERDIRDNEFVRYADTRAKNRALSDLTSAGALAVSELQGEE